MNFRLTEINSKQHTILVVDDNPTNLKVVVNYLKHYGFRMLMANSGESCLKRLSRVQPDLILLDIMMPDLDGFEVCERLKANEKTQNIPIIFMTALVEEDDKVRGFEVGAVDYITKPVQQREVLARVLTHLKLQTLQKQLEKEVVKHKQARKRLQAILDAMPNLLFIIDEDGRYVDVLCGNQEELYARPSELKGKLLHDILPKESADSFLDAIHQTIKTKKLHVIEYPLNVPKGELWFEGRIAYLGTIDAEKEMVVFLAYNITERKQATEILQKANKELTKLNIDKDKFFSIVAHDLKGPFLPLLANTEWLARKADSTSPAEVKEFGQSLHRSAKEVFNLLENLLHWSRLRMGRISYQPERLDLQALIELNIQLLSEAATTKQIQLNNLLQIPIFVHADEYMLNTIIRNLISNALKFTTPGGQVTIGSKKHKNAIEQTETSSVDSPFVEVWVSDTGVGISQNNVNNLFKIEVHHSTTGTNEEKGTGLGLIMCQEMVEKHGGRIWVESEFGVGATFRFTVPAIEPLPEGDWLIAQPDKPIITPEDDINTVDLIAPPLKELIELQKMAQIGSMKRVHRWVHRVSEMDEQYLPFCEQITELANLFDSIAIQELIEPYLLPANKGQATNDK